MPTESPRVESFVLRFVQDASEQGASSWHAVVLHVQSNEEKSFTDFADAVAFIARYVPLGDFVFKKDEGRNTDAKSFGHPSSVIGHSGE